MTTRKRIKQAAVDAIRGRQPHGAPRLRWSKESVIGELQSWHARGRPIKRLWVEFPALCHAMRRYFGSQDAALAAAGITEGRRWTEERVLEQLRAYRKRGLPRGGRDVPEALASAAHRLFGSWNAAIQAAGFTPVRCPAKPTRRSAQDVLRELQWRQTQGLPLTSTADPRLYEAAKVKFGSWCDALEAAGIACKRQQKWSKEQILDQLRRWDAEGHFDDSTWLEDRTFAYAAYRLFGSWPAALVEAGILVPGQKARRRTEWTRQRVIETLQDRHVNGPPISHKKDKKLIAAAIVRFGTWHAARRAAGIPAGRPKTQTRWTPEKVIGELRIRSERGQKMTNMDHTDACLADAARRYFGSYHDALVAAGLAAPREPRKRTRWTRERLIAEIQSRHREGRPLSSGCLNNGSLVRAALRLFGGWRAALQAAGIPGVRIPRAKWDHQRVLDEIRTQKRKGVPLRKTSVGQSLYLVACRRFGSWRAALAAAGVSPADLPSECERWSRQRVIDEIQSRHRQGLSLAYGAPDNGQLGAAGQKWFGSWRAALKAAGVPVKPEPRQQWSRQRILMELKAWRGRGVRPTRRHVGSNIQAAAHRYFGSWRKALVAAGVVGRESGR